MRRNISESATQPQSVYQASERISYLWDRARKYSLTIGRLLKLNSDIKHYGASRNLYFKKQTTYCQDSKSYYCIIMPHSCFKQLWNIVLIVLLLITATIMPYRICFETDTSIGWFIFELIIDILFVCDIIVNFNSAFYRSQDDLVTDHKSIAKSYIKGWFLIDLLGCLPFQFIETNDADSEQDYNKLLRLLRIPRLYRLVRIMRLVKMVRLFRSQSYVEKIIDTLKMTSGIIRIIRLTFTSLILVHLASCLWYYLAVFEELDIDTWIHRYDVLDKSQLEKYLVSIYFVFSTFTTVGYGDFSAFTNLEKVFAMGMMVFGTFFYSYVISNMFSVIDTADQHDKTYKNKIRSLNEFAVASKLPLDLVKRIRKFIKGNFMKPKNKFNIDILPYELKRQVSEYMFHKITEKFAFFHTKSPGFLSFVIPMLRSFSYKYEDYIYCEDDIAEDMYFVLNGRVNLLASNQVCFWSYLQGNYFGEIEILNKSYRESSAQVVSSCTDLYILSNQNVYDMLDEFPLVADEIKVLAQLRKVKIDESKEHALSLIPNLTEKESVHLESIDEEEEKKEDDEDEERRKKLNKEIWAKVLSCNDYTQSRNERKKTIHRFLSTKKKDLLFERNKPVPVFSPPIVHELPSLNSDFEGFNCRDHEEPELKIDPPKKIQLKDRLKYYEKAVNIQNIKTLNETQSSLSCSLQELLTLTKIK